MLGRALDPSRSRVDDDGRDGTFRGNMIRYLGSSPEEVYMGEGATSVEACGPHTTWWCVGGGGTVPPHGVVAPLPSSDSPLVSVVVAGKKDRGFSFRPIPRIFS